MKLTQEQYVKYSRQLILPEIQLEGQQKIFDARVLLVGLGGLGSPQAFYLAAAGVGTLGLLDGDRVDVTNLQRQIIHSTKEIGLFKVDSAEKRIKELNPDTNVIKHNLWITSETALDIVSGYDIVVDCTDNFPARYLLNDACVMLKKPLVHGAVYRFGGQATVFSPGRHGPCYRCLFPVPPPPGSVPSCGQAGVLGVVPGVVGLIQAGEVMKLILEKGEPLIGRLLICDVMAMNFQEVLLRRDPACPMCGDHPSIQTLLDYDVFCGTQAAARSQSHDTRVQPKAINVVDLARKLEAGEPLTFLDVREEWEQVIFPSFPRTVKIPYSTLASRWESLLPYKDDQIVVCCLFGYKSEETCRVLKAKGFEHLSNLQGGLEEWYLYQEQSS